MIISCLCLTSCLLLAQLSIMQSELALCGTCAMWQPRNVNKKIRTLFIQGCPHFRRFSDGQNSVLHYTISREYLIPARTLAFGMEPKTELTLRTRDLRVGLSLGGAYPSRESGEWTVLSVMIHIWVRGKIPFIRNETCWALSPPKLSAPSIVVCGFGLFKSQ